MSRNTLASTGAFDASNSTKRRIIAQVSTVLGRYVYLLVDPRNSLPFYVGKGQGVRFLSHGQAVPEQLDDYEGTKASRIRDIRDDGYEPEIWIARYGLTADEYTAVEAALIDLLASFPVTPAGGTRHRPLTQQTQLTNARREAARGHGMVLLERLIDDYAAPALTIAIPLLLVRLGPWTEKPEAIAGGRQRSGWGFKREWYDPDVRRQQIEELGASISAWWFVSSRRVQALGIDHAVAVFEGVTRGLFRIDHSSWETRDAGLSEAGRPMRRAAFGFDPVTSGDLFDAVVGPHGHLVLGMPKGAQNSIRYWPWAGAIPESTSALSR